MHPRQIENRRNISHEMIVRNDIIETEFIEQLALITLQPPHHRKSPPLDVVRKRNQCSRSKANDFYNKICHERTRASQQRPSLLDHFVGMQNDRLRDKKAK